MKRLIVGGVAALTVALATAAPTSAMHTKGLPRHVRRDGLAIKGRFDRDTEFGKSAYRNTKGRRVSGLSIGYASV